MLFALCCIRLQSYSIRIIALTKQEFSHSIWHGLPHILAKKTEQSKSIETDIKHLSKRCNHWLEKLLDQRSQDKHRPTWTGHILPSSSTLSCHLRTQLCSLQAAKAVDHIEGNNLKFSAMQLIYSRAEKTFSEWHWIYGQGHWRSKNRGFAVELCGSMYKLLFSLFSRTITKIHLPVNVPCLVNHWVINLNNVSVLSLSNSIKLLTKVIPKSTFQRKGSTIILSMTTLSNILILYLEIGIYPKTQVIYSKSQAKRYTNRLNRWNGNGKVRKRGRGEERERMENGTEQSPPRGHMCIVMCHISTLLEVRRQGRRIFS